MSIFNIFKRKPKPKNVTFEVLGNTYEVTLEGKQLSDEEKERMAKSRQERKEKERRIELRDKWMAIGMAFMAYRHFMESSDTIYPDDRTSERLREAHAEMRSIAQDPDFAECLQLATDDYSCMNGEKPTEEQICFATQPEEFNPEEMIRSKWLTFANGYREYWEEQIGLLKRKSAMTNRRRYLLEHLDGFIEKASTLSLDEAVRKLQEYKRYNEQILAE